MKVKLAFPSKPALAKEATLCASASTGTACSRRTGAAKGAFVKRLNSCEYAFYGELRQRFPSVGPTVCPKCDARNW